VKDEYPAFGLTAQAELITQEEDPGMQPQRSSGGPGMVQVVWAWVNYCPFLEFGC